MSHILVIDNDLVMRGLISNILRLDGYTIIETSDPLDALSIVAGKAQIHLVLTEIELKPISGVEFVKRMTCRKITIPTLFMAGYPNVAGVIARALGPGAVIEKPFLASSLRQKVARLLSKSSRVSIANRRVARDKKGA